MDGTRNIVVLATHSPIKMRASAILRQQWSLRMTLFIRQNCSLCTDAKDVMSKVWDRRPFEYTEIDVMAPNQTKWKNLYEFDTPVVSLFCAHLVDPVILTPSRCTSTKYVRTASTSKLLTKPAS
jgi:hypothetical protein